MTEENKPLSTWIKLVLLIIGIIIGETIVFLLTRK